MQSRKFIKVAILLLSYSAVNAFSLGKNQVLATKKYPYLDPKPSPKPSPSQNPHPSPSRILIYENNDEWSDGEVPWDLTTPINETITSIYISPQLSETVETRDKIWQFLEELRWKARLSGALKGMYVQLGTGDVIMNELENFDNCDTCNLSYDHLNIHLENKARNINNYNTEFEFLFTLATAVSYQIYKKYEQVDLREQPNLSGYFQARRQSLLLVLCILLIFTKNIKNAV
jgi:hypothetical protein